MNLKSYSMITLLQDGTKLAYQFFLDDSFGFPSISNTLNDLFKESTKYPILQKLLLNNPVVSAEIVENTSNFEN